MSYYSYDKPYQTGQKNSYKISRSKIEFYLECPRCFWLDRKLLIKRPDTPPFLINKTIDELFKKEFDIYRQAQQIPPRLEQFQIKAVPFLHKSIDDWRSTYKGINFLHKATNLLIFGAIDDVWVTEDGELIIVDYKATSKNKIIKDLDPEGGWHDSYRRQIEVYQWLFRQNGFEVSSTAYFVYTNADQSAERFDDQLQFQTNIFPYTGNDEWVEPTIIELKKILEQDEMPPISTKCNYCAYAKSRTELSLQALGRNVKKSTPI